jgi:hypothetical protein
MSANNATISEAVDAIRRRFVADGFRGTLKYATDEVIETDRWWYIPYGWIGCAGFIVNKDDSSIEAKGRRSNGPGSTRGKLCSHWLNY